MPSSGDSRGPPSLSDGLLTACVFLETWVVGRGGRAAQLPGTRVERPAAGDLCAGRSVCSFSRTFILLLCITISGFGRLRDPHGRGSQAWAACFQTALIREPLAPALGPVFAAAFRLAERNTAHRGRAARLRCQAGSSPHCAFGVRHDPSFLLGPISLGSGL